MSQLVWAGTAGMIPSHITELENVIRELGKPEPERVTEHAFVAGMYLRRFSMGPRILVVGRMHRHESVLIVLKGAMTVWSGGSVYHVAAPHQILSPAMCKRVVLSHTSIELLNIYPTKATTVEEAERELIVPEQEQLQ